LYELTAYGTAVTLVSLATQPWGTASLANAPVSSVSAAPGSAPSI